MAQRLPAAPAAQLVFKILYQSSRTDRPWPYCCLSGPRCTTLACLHWHALHALHHLPAALPTSAPSLPTSLPTTTTTRSAGRDHIFLWSHDEGACYAPENSWNAIMLTHWGRLDFPHSSNTGYWHDNYTLEVGAGAGAEVEVLLACLA